MLSMYLPGNAKVKASPVCMTVACVLIELAVIYQLIRRKKARTAGDIGAIVFFVLLFWQVYTTRLGRGHHPRADAGSRFLGLLYHARANDPWRILLALAASYRLRRVAAARRGSRTGRRLELSSARYRRADRTRAVANTGHHLCAVSYRDHAVVPLGFRHGFDHRYFLADVSADGSARRRAGSAHSRQRQSIGAETAESCYGRCSCRGSCPVYSPACAVRSPRPLCC